MKRRVFLEPMPYEFDLFGAKTCCHCGAVLPANRDYFNVDRSRDDGLTCDCSKCRCEADARYEAKRRAARVKA